MARYSARRVTASGVAGALLIAGIAVVASGGASAQDQAPTSTPDITTTQNVTTELPATESQQPSGQTMTINPAGPYMGGEEVAVTVTGFSPDATVAVNLCKLGRTVTSPGDCARRSWTSTSMPWIQTNAQGVGTASITIQRGPIGNILPPADSCGPANPCVIHALSMPTLSVPNLSDSDTVEQVLTFAPSSP